MLSPAKRNDKLLEVRLGRTLALDGEWLAAPVDGIADGCSYPTLGDAVLVDVVVLDAVKANADFPRQDRLIVKLAVGVDAESIWKRCVHSETMIPGYAEDKLYGY